MTFLVLGYAAGVVLLGGYTLHTWRTLRDLSR